MYAVIHCLGLGYNFVCTNKNIESRHYRLWFDIALVIIDLRDDYRPWNGLLIAWMIISAMNDRTYKNKIKKNKEN